MTPWEREALERLRKEEHEAGMPLYDYVDDEPPPGYEPRRPDWWDAYEDKNDLHLDDLHLAGTRG